MCPATDLIGGPDSPLLKWNPSYLKKHLPKDMTWPVLHQGTSKIIMTHTNRYLKTEELQAMEKQEAEAQGFRRVRRTWMSFAEYLAAVKMHEAKVEAGEASEPPYLGSDILWRNSMADNGFVQNIGDRLKSELLGGANFPALKKLMDAGHLPLMKQVHLFIGSARTLYHCHYDLQPNLHVQLVGRKRFIMFPPFEGSKLYPFPVHHDNDRRSRIDWDAPDEARFPGCLGAQAQVAELRPGEVLYIPPGWWHHVQTCTSPCVSMAWWFFERRREHARPEDGIPDGLVVESHEPVDRHCFGVCPGMRLVSLSRWLEESIGRLLEVDAEVEEQQAALGGKVAKEKGAVWGGPKKERAVAQWLRALGRAAAQRLVTRGDATAVEAVNLLQTPAEQQSQPLPHGLGEPQALESGGVHDASMAEALPPLQQGVGFDMVEEVLLERIKATLGSNLSNIGRAPLATDEETDRWICGVVRGRFDG